MRIVSYPLKESMIPNPLSPYAFQKLIGNIIANYFQIYIHMIKVKLPDALIAATSIYLDA